MRARANADAEIPVESIRLNDGTQGLPKNPRFIRDAKFRKLVESVRENPEYMPARPIIVDETGTILGGNMRYRACLALGKTTLPASWVQRVSGWPLEKKRRFIILDNRGFGEDDLDLLANEWNLEELSAAGFDCPDLADDENSDEAEEHDKALAPMHHCHILLRMTLEQSMNILPMLESICKQHNVEVMRGSN